MYGIPVMFVKVCILSYVLLVHTSILHTAQDSCRGGREWIERCASKKGR